MDALPRRPTPPPPPPCPAPAAGRGAARAGRTRLRLGELTLRHRTRRHRGRGRRHAPALAGKALSAYLGTCVGRRACTARAPSRGGHSGHVRCAGSPDCTSRPTRRLTSLVRAAGRCRAGAAVTWIAEDSVVMGSARLTRPYPYLWARPGRVRCAGSPERISAEAPTPVAVEHAAGALPGQGCRVADLRGPVCRPQVRRASAVRGGTSGAARTASRALWRVELSGTRAESWIAGAYPGEPRRQSPRCTLRNVLPGQR
jgi:hypothetical protein